MYKEQAVTSCACLVRFTWDALRNESAVPELAMSAWHSTLVQPLFSSQSPIVLKAAISMWRPPNRMTTCYSENLSGQVHWISFANAKRGWSHVMTGVCPGLRKLTIFLIISKACRIIATDFASSWNKGNNELMSITVSGLSCSLFAWKAYQEYTMHSLLSAAIFSWTCSNHLKY